MTNNDKRILELETSLEGRINGCLASASTEDLLEISKLVLSSDDPEIKELESLIEES